MKGNQKRKTKQTPKTMNMTKETTAEASERDSQDTPSATRGQEFGDAFLVEDSVLHEEEGFDRCAFFVETFRERRHGPRRNAFDTDGRKIDNTPTDDEKDKRKINAAMGRDTKIPPISL